MIAKSNQSLFGSRTYEKTITKLTILKSQYQGNNIYISKLIDRQHVQHIVSNQDHYQQFLYYY